MEGAVVGVAVVAEATAVVVVDVLVADASRRTTALNAYVSGLGSTRRIVVHDTLLDRGRDDEVRAVLLGETLDESRHGVRTAVKAVTWHELFVRADQRFRDVPPAEFAKSWRECRFNSQPVPPSPRG